MVSYQWIGDEATGILEVTDIASPLQNEGWGLGPYTGRLIELRIDVQRGEGGFSIHPLYADQATLDGYGDLGSPGMREIGPNEWGYSFDFASGLFTGFFGYANSIQQTLYNDRFTVLKDGYVPYELALETHLGHWERVVTINEPMTLALLILALLLQFLSTRGELKL